MAVEPAGPFLRGEGWVAWRDPLGIVSTHDWAPQTGASARARLAAIERLLGGDAVGLLVDDEPPAGDDDPEAWEAYIDFVRRHPALRIAVVTSSPVTFVGSEKVRRSTRGTLGIFRTRSVARRWLLLPAGPPPEAPPRGSRT